jgi:TolB-like protein
VLVDKFEDLTGTQTGSAIATGLTHEIISQLSKFKDIVVMETRASDGDKSISPPRFVLAGSIDRSADAFQLRVRLINGLDGSVIWANSYNGAMKVGELVKAQADIAKNVSTSLAQAYGVIFQADANAQVASPPEDWAAYSCSLSYYAYREDLDPEKRSSVRACLQAAVDRFPSYATGWGLLSLIYIDEYRYGFAADPNTRALALRRATAAARQATGLDPLNMRGRQAEMLALFFNKETEAALQVGKLALANNPNDTEFMSNYGERLALSGKWSEGCALIEEARQRNPGYSADYQASLGLCSYFSGDYSQAIMWITRTPSDKNPIYHLLSAAFYGEAGKKMEAGRECAWLEQNQPDLIKDIRNQLSMRLGRAQDVETFIGSLRKAGLEIAD